MAQRPKFVVRAHAHEMTGVAVLILIEHGKETSKVARKVSATQYQMPAVMLHRGVKYVAFSEYYAGTFEPYVAYKMTQLQEKAK